MNEWAVSHRFSRGIILFKLCAHSLFNCVYLFGMSTISKLSVSVYEAGVILTCMKQSLINTYRKSENKIGQHGKLSWWKELFTGGPDHISEGTVLEMLYWQKRAKTCIMLGITIVLLCNWVIAKQCCSWLQPTSLLQPLSSFCLCS